MIIPFGLHHSEITARNLLKVDLQGNVQAIPRPLLTGRTVHEIDTLLDLIWHRREAGYAGNDGELEFGVRLIAVPVRNLSGATVVAISSAVRVERMTLA